MSDIAGSISAITTSNNQLFIVEDATKSSISVDGQLANVNMVHISKAEYAQLVVTSSTVSSTLYIVSSDVIDAYGQQISNLAPGTGLSDAVNLEQLSNAISSIQIPTDLSAFTNSPGYLSSIETVAPTSANSGKGKAADAKATGIALYTGFTEWVCDEISEGYTYEACSWAFFPPLYRTGWICFFTNPAGVYQSTYLGDNFYAVSLSNSANPQISLFRHLVTPTKTSQLSNDSGFLSAIPNTYALKTDIQMSYHQNEHKIVLSAGSNETSVDCSDFIKDGMLSAAELCGTQLVLTFNTDAGSQPISVDLSNFVDNYDDKVTYLSSVISSKITIVDKLANVSAQNANLSVVKLSTSEYEDMIVNGTTLSNCLYIVDNSFVDMYNEQIKYLAPGTDQTDAVNMQQLSNAISSINQQLGNIESILNSL